MEQRKMKILWLDDDIFRLKLQPYIDELRDKGFEVISVDNPDDIEKHIVSNKDIKCIITDISMPKGGSINTSEAKMGMRTGFVILKKLNKNPNLNSIPKVIFSIANDEQIRQYCASNNIEYLNKQEYLTDTFVEKIISIISHCNKEIETNSLNCPLGIDQHDSIAKILHEIISPVSAIHTAASRLRKNKNDILFMERYFNSYLDTICELSGSLLHEIRKINK